MRFSKGTIAQISIAIFVFIVFAFSTAKLPISDNDTSRLAGIVSIVQNNKLEIDDTPYNKVGDRIVYKSISYSSKPPVLHVVTGYFLKSVFTIIKPVLINNYSAIYRAATILINVFPLTIIFCLFTYILQKYLKIDSIVSTAYSLFLIFGTLLFSYSSYLTNHIIEALAQVMLFALLIRNTQNKVTYLWIGIVLSMLFAIDITNGVIAVPITLVWLIKYKKAGIVDFLWILLGAVPLLFTHFYLSYLQFENFLPPQLFPSTYLSYEGSKWIGNVQGFEKLNDPILIRFFNYTFGTHGLFLYQPILIIPFLIKRNWKNPLWIYTFAIVFSYILFNTIMQKNYAGSAFGPRRFLPLIPIIFYFVVTDLKDYWNNFDIFKKVLVILAFVFTAAISYLGYTNPWNNYFVERNSEEIYFPILYTLEKTLGVGK